MYYEVHGSGPPLVSIHPALGLANVFPSLAGRRTLIAMDLQGHGRTPDLDRRLSFEQNADDVIPCNRQRRLERKFLQVDEVVGQRHLQSKIGQPRAGRHYPGREGGNDDE